MDENSVQMNLWWLLRRSESKWTSKNCIIRRSINIYMSERERERKRDRGSKKTNAIEIERVKRKRWRAEVRYRGGEQRRERVERGQRIYKDGGNTHEGMDSGKCERVKDNFAPKKCTRYRRCQLNNWRIRWPAHFNSRPIHSCISHTWNITNNINVMWTWNIFRHPKNSKFMFILHQMQNNFTC